MTIIWTYDVPAPMRGLFEAAYAPDGDWARLFSASPDFLGTELLHDGAGRYATIDRWRAEGAFEAFKAAHAEAYAALDEACAAFTTAEHRIGAFEAA